jgi:hypothetical protein
MRVIHIPKGECVVADRHDLSIEAAYENVGEHINPRFDLRIKDICVFLDAQTYVDHEHHAIGSFRVKRHKTKNLWCVKFCAFGSTVHYIYIKGLKLWYKNALVEVMTKEPVPCVQPDWVATAPILRATHKNIGDNIVLMYYTANILAAVFVRF